ncbi:DegV family protein [[Mycoplasma] mobile]|uniref:DegV homolog n=1 Tax=Mycoplasma mobile (strain ATCC 43663 / 163K / NCTC 11711) TaxID=267748 RepID=Q6KHB2_MYCM1|nr:DegV family protein [[Mycoplasma] mobile]AAT28018.1 degV homolog [Mycoplasma mobile 163K]
MKHAIVVDSSSGLTKEEAEKKGWFFLPLIIDIDDKTYLDGIEINSENLYQFWKSNSVIKTGTTPPKYSLELFEKLSNEYDAVIVYPLSSELSSQYNNLLVMSKNLKNVSIIHSYGVAQLIPYELEQLENKLKSGEITVQQGIALLEGKKDSTLHLIPENLTALVKGGRVSPAIAKLAKLLNIVPIIEVREGKLEKAGKGRHFRKSITKLAEKRFEEISKEDLSLYDVVLLHSKNDDVKEIASEIESIVNKKITIKLIPSVVAIHTGKKAIGLCFFKKTNFDLVTQYLKTNKK